MYKEAGDFVYSPSDLIVFSESRFASWMERYHLEFPEIVEPDEESEAEKFMKERGHVHEKAWLDKLCTEGRDVCVISQAGDLHAETVAAMHAGRETIYQARLNGLGLAARQTATFKTTSRP